MIEEGLEVENYDPNTFNTSKFTYFEYLFGLGKLLLDKYPLLFKSSQSEHEADSIGFNLVAICINHNLKHLSKLPRTLEKLNLDNLEEKILEAIEFVNRILRPYIGLKANKKNGSEFPIVHSEFQIISIIGKVFRSMFYINAGTGDILENPTWEEIKLNLENNIPYHYLYDIIKGYWSGTGDKKAMERASSVRYENTIDKEAWSSALQDWYENEKNKKEKARVRINPTSVLFLKYIYTHLLTAREELSSTEFEIDHIIPFARLRNIALQVGGLPISAISNLALIKKELNRKKREKTIYEYYDSLVKRGELTEEQVAKEIKQIEKYTFTTHNMLNFIQSLNKENIQDFYTFLDTRFEILKNQFFQLNNIR